MQRTGDFLKKGGQWVKQHKKLFIILVSLLLVSAISLGIFLWLVSGVQTSAATMPDVTALQKIDLEQTVTATGTLQSANTREVSSNFSYEVEALYVAVGDSVTQEQPLCRLDTTELDENIAQANENIAEAVASDKLALEQAERKLQDAINTRDINWNQNVAAVNNAESALATANDTLSGANGKLSGAQSTASSCAVDLQTAQTNFNAWKTANPAEPDTNNPYYTAVQNAQTACDTAAALATAFTDTVTEFLGRYYARNNEYGISAFSMESTVESLTSMLSTVSLAIAAISLLVGGIGVMNIMMVSITERTHEIGTRKAIGATNSEIRIQFIMEAIVICLVGGIIGIVLGVSLGSLTASLLGYPAQASVSIMQLAAAFSMAIGVFFGYYPANKAAKLDPIDALRYE